jgi:hypothetical protein
MSSSHSKGAPTDSTPLSPLPFSTIPVTSPLSLATPPSPVSHQHQTTPPNVVKTVTGYAWKRDTQPDVKTSPDCVRLYGTHVDSRGVVREEWSDELWFCRDYPWPEDMLAMYAQFRINNPLPTHHWPLYPSDSDELPCQMIERPPPVVIKEDKQSGILNKVKYNNS